MAFETSLVNLTNINFSNFFETTLKTAVTDGTDTNIYLTALPTDDDGASITEGFLTIEPTSSSKREIVYFNAVGADYATVPSAANGRGVGGTTAQGHASSSVVRMTPTAEVMRLFRDRLSSPLSSKVISSTRDLAAASGDVAYTGVGFVPTAIVALSANLGSTMSFGVCDSAKTEKSIAQLSDGAGSSDVNALLQLSTGIGAQQSCIVKSFDADGFTLTWTKTGSPTGTVTLIFLCFK